MTTPMTLKEAQSFVAWMLAYPHIRAEAEAARGLTGPCARLPLRDLDQALRQIRGRSMSARQIAIALGWRTVQAEQALSELHRLGCARPGTEPGTYSATEQALPRRAAHSYNPTPGLW